jgi:hypothetical protein
MMNEHTQLAPAAPERWINPVAVAEEARGALMKAVEPAEIIQIEAKLDAVECLMRDAGLYPLGEIRPITEARMRARWCLGLALESVAKEKPGPKPQGVTSAGLMHFLRELELDHQTALEARRIAALPDGVLVKAFEEWRSRPDLLHYTDLIQIARPFWNVEKRREMHKRIAEQESAAKSDAPDKSGPFALIYAIRRGYSRPTQRRRLSCRMSIIRR